MLTLYQVGGGFIQGKYDSMYRLSKAGTWSGDTIEYSYDEVGGPGDREQGL